MSDEPPAAAPIPTPRYQEILHSATRIALQMGHSHVGAEHLFLAIIRDPDAMPTGQLAAVTAISGIEDKVLDVMNSGLYCTTALPPADR